MLRQLGVTGRDDQLDPVVESWDGHALTLSLLGTYLAWRIDGDVVHANMSAVIRIRLFRFIGAPIFFREEDVSLNYFWERSTRV